MKENSMNKTTYANSQDDEMLDDYSDTLTPSDLKKAIRGKYAQSLAESNSSTVKITGKNGDRYVTMKTIEVEALVNNEGQLTIEVPSTLNEGKYHAILMIEEPTGENC